MSSGVTSTRIFRNTHGIIIAGRKKAFEYNADFTCVLVWSCITMFQSSTDCVYVMVVVPEDYNKAGNFLLPSDIIAFLTQQTHVMLQPKVAKIKKAVIEMANIFNLGVKKADTEGLLEVVPEKVTKEELLELEQNAQLKKIQKERKLQGGKRTFKKFFSEGFSRSFLQISTSFLKV